MRTSAGRSPKPSRPAHEPRRRVSRSASLRQSSQPGAYATVVLAGPREEEDEEPGEQEGIGMRA
jgi:hypothetical protein